MKKIAVALSMLVVVACADKEFYKTYLIPEGYEGPLVIIEGVDSGMALTKIGDTLTFDFRKSAILRFKEKFIEGSNPLANLKYYYVGNDGRRKEIHYALSDVKKVDSSIPYVYLKYSQIGSNSQCDLVSTASNLRHNLRLQQKLCDSLLSRHPN